jgi:aldose 1-epimerase
MQATQAKYGTTSDGRTVTLFTLENSHGMRVTVIDLGVTVTSVIVPDRSGKTANVSLAYPDLAGWEKNTPFFGCIVGRVANRIRGGTFDLDGKRYTLARNIGENHLHGGLKGFDKYVWPGKLFKKGSAVGIRFQHTSPNSDEGYPGTLRVTAEYVLTENNELSFEYWATTDKPTPVNITNHAYWNLAGAVPGEDAGTMLAQEARFNCPFYLPVDGTLMPTGEILKTAGTPFDFSSFKPIGRDIGSIPGGYDHCFVVGKHDGPLGLVGTVRDPSSGRTMEVRTSMPGVQLYAGNSLDIPLFPKHGGFCLETQWFPDSANIRHFPDSILRPGGTYHHRTVHRFS